MHFHTEELAKLLLFFLDKHIAGCLIFDPVENPPNGHNRDSERLPETASNLA